MRPRKYFCATMFVAVCDQNFGNSTPVLPRDVRVAHLPFDLVVRVAPLDREQPADADRGVLVDDAVHELVGMDVNGALDLCARHTSAFLVAHVARARLSKQGKGP